MDDNYGNDFVVLVDEDGNEVEFEHIYTLEHNGEIYMAFIPAELNVEEQAEVVIMKVQEEDGEEILVAVEDDDEADEVYSIIMEKFEEEEEAE